MIDLVHRVTSSEHNRAQGSKEIGGSYGNVVDNVGVEFNLNMVEKGVYFLRDTSGGGVRVGLVS
jgi:hypothetical protein